MDSIDWYTFEHTNYNEGGLTRGLFDHNLNYQEAEIPIKIAKSRRIKTEPYLSPTHAGGVFAIDKNWFSELGTYDNGLKFWGAEQLELSFKVYFIY